MMDGCLMAAAGRDCERLFAIPPFLWYDMWDIRTDR